LYAISNVLFTIALTKLKIIKNTGYIGSICASQNQKEKKLIEIFLRGF